MEDIQSTSNYTEIDVSQVDWNLLSPEEFQAIERQLQTTNKIAKAQKGRQTKTKGTVAVQISGKTYDLKIQTFEKLKKMKSLKSKEKLIEEIIATYSAIIDL